MPELDKRKLIQLFSAVIYNADAGNFLSGTVSRSPLKHVCVPGLNCYSCPSAVASCPLGALQGALGGGRFPFFVTGFLLLSGVLAGRAVCGFLCPFGFFQELLHKAGEKVSRMIPGSGGKASPSLKSVAARRAQVSKYFFLFVFVLFLPYAGYMLSGLQVPYFCSWICPAGTLEAGIPLVIANSAMRSAVGFLFAWKTFLLAFLVIWSFIVFRPFCKYFCPLGAFYSFFNRIAVFGVTVDSGKCSNCGKCTAFCKMNAKAVNSLECIRCGDCIRVCPENAISIRGLVIHKKKGYSTEV